MTNEQYAIMQPVLFLLITVFTASSFVAKVLTNSMKSSVSSTVGSESALIGHYYPGEDPMGSAIIPSNLRNKITRCLRKSIRCLFTMPCYLRDYESCGLDEHT